MRVTFLSRSGCTTASGLSMRGSGARYGGRSALRLSSRRVAWARMSEARGFITVGNKSCSHAASHSEQLTYRHGELIVTLTSHCSLMVVAAGVFNEQARK
jgi:hypothetical protein